MSTPGKAGSIEVEVHSANGPGGTPGTLLRSFTAAVSGIDTAGVFQHLDVSGEDLDVPAVFYVVVGLDRSVNDFLHCADEDGIRGNQPIWVADDGRPWVGFRERFPDTRTFMTRAVVTGPGGKESCSTEPCVEDEQTICLNGSRFRVNGFFDTVNDDDTLLEPMGAESLTGDTGTLYFKNPDNVEVVVKVLDACIPAFDRYWVFLAGLTHVEVQVNVCDTLHGLMNVYSNPQGTPFQPIQDTAAFTTCP